MKANRGLVEVAVMNKIRTLAFESIVNEAFMKALPFDRSELDMTCESTLGEYTKNVIDRMGGYAALENAIINEKDPRKKILLKDIDRICTEAALKVTKRITSEETTMDTAMDEIAADAGFTKDEYHDFEKNADDLDLDKIADIVKDKVVDTLKCEKEDHARVDNVNDKLADVIKKDDEKHNEHVEDRKPDKDQGSDSEVETPDPNLGQGSPDDSENTAGQNIPTSPETENPMKSEPSEPKKDEHGDGDESLTTAKESYVRLIIGDPRKLQHRSLFNSIQQAACEQIMRTEDISKMNPDVVSLRRLQKITFENTFSIFKKDKSAMESLEDIALIQSAAVQNKANQNIKTVMEATMIDSAIVYTMLESLHTMNLLNVGVSDARIAVESSMPFDMKVGMAKNEVNRELKAATRKMASESVLTYTTESVCNEKLQSLDRISEVLHSCMENVDVGALKMIDDRRSAIAARKKSLSAKKSTTATEGYFDKIVNERNVAQMNKVAIMAKLIGPRVKEIVIEQTENDGSYDVHIMQNNGQVTNTFITLESVACNANELRRLAEKSKLHDGAAPDTYLKLHDGRGTKTILT